MKRNCFHPFMLLVVMLNLNVLAGRVDFGDHSSNTLIVKASEAKKQKDWKAVEAYCEKCIQLYTSQARQMQRKLKDYPDDNSSLGYWALNHVAYCHFILGEMYLEIGKEKKAYKEFETVVDDYEFSTCFDPEQNSFWKIAVESKFKMARLEGEYGSDSFKKGNSSKTFLDPKSKLRPLPKPPKIN